MPDVKKSIHKPCRKTVYWRQKEDGHYEPPWEDEACTIRHYCDSSNNFKKSSGEKEIPFEVGVESLKKTMSFIGDLRTKKKMKARYIAQDLNVNDWDDFWSSLQDSRDVMKRCLELLEEEE